MSVLDLNALNALPKVERILALAETNAQLEKLDAEGRVAWALENLPERCPNVIEFRNLCRQAPAEMKNRPLTTSGKKTATGPLVRKPRPSMA